MITSDGVGNFTAIETLSIGGTVGPRTMRGTYTVRADCTGSLSGTDSRGVSYRGEFVLVDGGRASFFIETGAATVITSVGRKQ